MNEFPAFGRTEPTCYVIILEGGGVVCVFFIEYARRMANLGPLALESVCMHTNAYVLIPNWECEYRHSI